MALVHQNDHILAVGGVDDAAVIAAGVHAAALAGHPDHTKWQLISFMTQDLL